MLQEEVSTAQVRAALHQAADGGSPVEGLQPVQPPQQSTPGTPAHDAGAHRLPWGGEQDDELLHTKHQLQICRVSQDFTTLTPSSPSVRTRPLFYQEDLAISLNLRGNFRNLGRNWPDFNLEVKWKFYLKKLRVPRISRAPDIWPFASSGGSVCSVWCRVFTGDWRLLSLLRPPLSIKM